MKNAINTQKHTSLSHTEYEIYLEGIIDTIREALLILNKDLRVISANKTFYEKFKVKQSETENVLVYQLGNGQWNIPDLRQLLEELLPKHNPFSDYRVEHNFPHIGKKVMLLNARQIKEKGRWQDRILLAIEDITKYDRDKKAKDAGIEREKSFARELQTSQAKLLQNMDDLHKYKSLIDNSKDFIGFSDLKGNAIFVNEAGRKMVGLKAKEVIGTKVEDYLPKFQRATIKKLMKKLEKGEEIVEEVSFQHFKTKKLIPVSWSGIIIYSPRTKKPIGFGTVTRNIEEQKKADEIQRRLAAIVESSDDAIVSKNLDGIIMSWNKGAEKIFGYKEKEMIGKSIRTIIPPELQTEEDSILARLRQGKRIQHFQTVRMAKDGRRVIISLSVSPMETKEGKVIGASKIARDITQQVQLQKQKDEFLGIASHELKTPVTSIKSFTQVLRLRFAKEGNQKAVDLLGKLDAQINKLTNLIGDLLDVTKIESGKMRYNDDYFPFDELVAEVVEELQRTTDRHTLIINGKSGKTIFADRERISQVLVNLISNAIKYSPYSKEIIIIPSVEGNNIKLCVQDFGVGIAKEKKDKVFERFFRASGPGKDTYPGLGLGLYISSEIIKRSQGRMWVESIEGKGSTFCFTLPIKKDSQKKKTSRKYTEEEIRFG